MWTMRADALAELCTRIHSEYQRRSRSFLSCIHQDAAGHQDGDEEKTSDPVLVHRRCEPELVHRQDSEDVESGSVSVLVSTPYGRVLCEFGISDDDFRRSDHVGRVGAEVTRWPMLLQQPCKSTVCDGPG